MNLNYSDEKSLMLLIRGLLDEADIAVAHNGKRFDDRISRAAFLLNDIKPPSPWKNVDTKLIAKQVGMFPSNSLNDLCEMFGFGTKTKTTYADLWYECLIDNNPKSWKLMEKYNNQDVELLTKLYEKLLPYATTHPNISVITGISHSCPRCGGTNLIRRGTRTTNASLFQRWNCKDCGAFPSSRISEKTTTKSEFVSYS